MKEVTECNDRPREMWVWDNDGEPKQKRIVLFVFPPNSKKYPVVALREDKTDTELFAHCVEIVDEPKQRLMTYKELSRWLRFKTDREWMASGGSVVKSYCTYDIAQADDPVPPCVLVREGDGEWHQPLKAVEGRTAMGM